MWSSKNDEVGWTKDAFSHKNIVFEWWWRKKGKDDDKLYFEAKREIDDVIVKDTPITRGEAPNRLKDGKDVFTVDKDLSLWISQSASKDPDIKLALEKFP